MFDWAKAQIAQFEPTAIAYVENLTFMGVVLVVLVGLISFVYYIIAGWIRNGDPAYSDGNVYLKILSKLMAAFSLPAAPALVMSVFYPKLLGQIEGIQAPIAFAGFALLWASLRVLRE